MVVEYLSDAFNHFSLALQGLWIWKTMLLMAVGVAGGLVAGAIPGFTIAMAVVLTLPFTFSMPPEQGAGPWNRLSQMGLLMRYSILLQRNGLTLYVAVVLTLVKTVCRHQVGVVFRI